MDGDSFLQTDPRLGRPVLGHQHIPLVEQAVGSELRIVQLARHGQAGLDMAVAQLEQLSR